MPVRTRLFYKTLKQLADRLESVANEHGAVAGGVDGPTAVDAEFLVNTNRVILWSEGEIGNIASVAVGATDDLAARHASASERDGIRAHVMIAALVAIELRRAAKLRDEANQRLIQQASLVQVLDQGGKGMVHAAHHHPVPDSSRPGPR